MLKSELFYLFLLPMPVILLMAFSLKHKPVRKILRAEIDSENLVAVQLLNPPESIKKGDVRINGLKILSIDLKDEKLEIKTSPLDISEFYSISIKGMGKRYLTPGKILDKFYSEKPPGVSFESGGTVFRLFAPRAKYVNLVIFKNYRDNSGVEYEMKKDKDGVWEYSLPGKLYGTYYGYRVDGPGHRTEMFDPSIIFADPYSRAVVTRNDYLDGGKSIIVPAKYDWEGDTWSGIQMEDLIIYEMHVRDMTVHPSSGVSAAGTYCGLIEKGKPGGLAHLLDLGINAVELLPIHEFTNIEFPYKKRLLGKVNDLNPYERNHWGYMTSFFFAPEGYYASRGNMKWGDYNGIHGQQVKEFKDMVKCFHKEGIAVILDVVYNHVSDWDLTNFKYIDKKYYFHLDSDSNFIARSHCGNDFKTDRPMVRKLILDSVKFWMTEYHVDGFRFDIAYLLDQETCQAIIEEARRINPGAIIIAEPWNGGYNPSGFSRMGWAAWNDQFRNGIKGRDPTGDQGFIFGSWMGKNDINSIKRYIKGSLVEDGGPFVDKSHSINYLESHDDYTLGDFIRIALGDVKESDRIEELDSHVSLTERQMRLNKLAALILFSSQGTVMIHEGQEFARSKVIAHTDVPDPDRGKIDRNSYNKDNETNWINYRHKEINRELYEYYKGLIELRKSYPAFRWSSREDIRFLPVNSEFALGYRINGDFRSNDKSFVVLLNAEPDKDVKFTLPEGSWAVMVNDKKAGKTVIDRGISGEIKVAQTSGIVLIGDHT